MLNLKLLTKLIHQIQKPLIAIDFRLTRIHPFHILRELHRPMDLQLLVRHNHIRGHLQRLRRLERRLDLVIIHLTNNLEPELERRDAGISATRVLVSERAPVPHVALQQEVRWPVGFRAFDAFGVVGEVYDAVLDALEVGGFAVVLVEHAVLPLGS